jgi:hypothetical protein
MSEEQYVGCETAKLLKDRGFKEKCVYFYDWDEEDEIYRICSNGESCNEARFPSYYSMPTQQMAMQWLREVHHIHVCPEYKAFFQEKPKKIYHHWCSKIVGIDRYFKRGINDVDVLDSDYFFFSINARAYHDSYEEACEECIKFALENLVTD